MPHNFAVPLTPEKYQSIKNTTNIEMQPALTDPMFEFLDGSNTILFKGELRDLGTNTARRRMRQELDMVDPDVAVAKFATAEYKQKMAKGLEDARAALRNVAPPITGTPPLPSPPVDPKDSAVAAMEKMLGSDGGGVIGYDHADQSSKDFIENLIKSAGPSGKIKHVFVEEFPIELQQDIDDFLANPVGDMSPALHKHIDEKKSYQVNFLPMLEAARLHGVKVHGIDSILADPGVAAADPRYHERRLTMMNAIAKDVFDQVRNDYPGEPFVAMTGDDHVNTAIGGIPGLSQIMGVPGISYNVNMDRIVQRQEDTTRRGTPSEAAAEFIDLFLAKAKRDYSEFVDTYKQEEPYKSANPKPALSESLTLKDIHAVAHKLADDFTRKGLLNAPGDGAKLLTSHEVSVALAQNYRVTIGRSDRINKLTGSIGNGNVEELRQCLDEDPFLRAYKTDGISESGLLHAAAMAGQAGIIDELCKQGLDPNEVDLNGETPLVRIMTGRGTRPPEQLADGFAALLRNNANPNLPGPDGRTAVDLVKNGPKAHESTVKAFTKAGAMNYEELFIRKFMSAADAGYKTAREEAVKKDAKKGYAPMIDKAEARKVATALVATLGGGVVFNTPASLAFGLKDQATVNAQDKLVDSTLERAELRNSLLGVVQDKAGTYKGKPKERMTEIKRLLDLDPALLEVNIDAAEERTILSLAAVQNDKALFRELLKVRKVDPNHKDTRGRTALHVLLSQEVGKIDQAKHKEINGNIRRLVAGGADVNARNNGGETALHQAAFMNNVGALGVLKRRGADPKIKNNAGWTPADTALGGTNKEAEEELYKLGLADRKPPLEDGTFSSVDLLCQATLCQDPKQITQVRTGYERLYADPSMRKMLDLAAKATANDRNPPKGGLRLFASTGNNVGLLYSYGNGPSGAYDEKVNTLLFPMAGHMKDKEPLGTLAHEMTHLVAHLATGDPETLPWTTDEEKKDYLKAIQDDLKKLHLLDDNNEAEAFIKDRFSSRMTDYAKKATPTGKVDRTGEEYDEALLQEYLVGVPQIAATYGMEFVEKNIPNLANYYKKFCDSCEEIGNTDPRFQKGRAKISTQANNAMVVKATRLAKPTDTRDTMANDSKSYKVDAVLAKIRQGVIAGQDKPSLPPGGRTIAFQIEDYKLSDQQETELKQKLDLIKPLIEKDLASGNLPSGVPTASYKELISSLTTSVRDLGGSELKDMVGLQTKTWIKSAKVASVDREISKKGRMDVTDLATAIVFRAEAKARGGSRPNPDDVTEASAKKQSQMISQLAAALQKPEYASKLSDPAKLIDTMSEALAVKQNKAFYQKKPDSDPQHISIDTKRARRVWTAQLAGMK